MVGGLPHFFPLQPHSPKKSKGGFFKHCESSQVSLLLKTPRCLPATSRMKYKLLAQLSQHSVTRPQGHSTAQLQAPSLTRPPHEQWQASAYGPPLTSHLPAPTALQPRQPPFCSSTCLCVSCSLCLMYSTPELCVAHSLPVIFQLWCHVLRKTLQST